MSGAQGHGSVTAAARCNIGALPFCPRIPNVKQARLDPVFLERQKKKLQALRAQILSAQRGETREEAGANTEVQAQAHEAEDDAQRLASVELEGNLAAFADTRLSDIERALQKIDAGTYGVSESSGAPIPVERLEAYPEARDTLEEQKSRDARRDAAG
jgi:DnaK suppressor protein